MKGLNSVNMKKVLADLKVLKEIKESQNCLQHPLVLDVVDWVEKPNEFDTFIDLLENIHKQNRNNVTIIIDSLMLAPDGLYLPEDIILTQKREVVKRFLDLAEDEIGYMKQYLDLCFFFFEQDDEEIQSYIKSEPVLMDIQENYKKLTIEEMVERYKDQRFFKGNK